MRALFPTLILFLLTGVLAAGDSLNDSSSRCRTDKLEFPASFSVGDRVKADLKQGIWSEEVTTAKSGKYVQFNLDGTADMVCRNASGAPFYKQFSWDVEEYHGLAYLVLKDENRNKEHIYRVETTCRGVMLTDVSSYQEMHLLYEAEKSDKMLGISKERLAGDWVNASRPQLTADQISASQAGGKQAVSYLNYEFHANGTYMKTYGTPSVHFEEKGTFELSKDGRFLFLHAQSKNGVVATQVARIKYLSMGELVLEQSLNAVEAEDCLDTEMATIAFMQ